MGVGMRMIMGLMRVVMRALVVVMRMGVIVVRVRRWLVDDLFFMAVDDDVDLGGLNARARAVALFQLGAERERLRDGL